MYVLHAAKPWLLCSNIRCNIPSKTKQFNTTIMIMIRKWIKKLLAPIVREVINEEKLQEQVIGHIATALKEALDSGECDNLKRPNV